MECVENVQGNLLVYAVTAQDVCALRSLGLSEVCVHQLGGPSVIRERKGIPQKFLNIASLKNPEISVN